MSTISINDIQKLGHNIYRHNGRYYRLFARGITPNNCWLIAPMMRELLDIVADTGKDIYGDGVLEFDGVTGTVPAHYAYEVDSDVMGL